MNQSAKTREKTHEEIVEEKIEADLKAEGSIFKRFAAHPWTITILLVIIILGAAFGVLYEKVFASRVYIDTAVVRAQTINLSPTSTGTLEEVYVHEGDVIPAETPVARVGNEIIKTKVASQVISVQNNIGTIYNPGQTVVSVIDPSQLRVVGTLEEDKGLKDVKVGEPAYFTVDTFGSQKYVGVVDEISPTAHADDIVFNISDQRQISQYDVKVRFDISSYPELKNGMSAKIWIYKQ